MKCSERVFRCFRAIERFGDRVTGAAGPFFIGLAVILLSLAIFTFFTVIQPELPWPWFTTPICLLIATNLMANYYYACTVPPGFVGVDTPLVESVFLSRLRRNRNSSRNIHWSEEGDMTRARCSKCRKCGLQRPERAHHCRICKACVLKYDHHCPVSTRTRVINITSSYALVFYLVLGTLFFITLGWTKMKTVFDLFSEWEHFTPSVIFILIYVLSVAISIAVGIMLWWHMSSVMRGETTVENYDHDMYRKIAGSRGEVFVNSYNLGKRRNLELFFNIGPSGYSSLVLLLPLKTVPYTDGWSWARREGLMNHVGVELNDQMTDSEDDTQ